MTQHERDTYVVVRLGHLTSVRRNRLSGETESSWRITEFAFLRPDEPSVDWVVHCSLCPAGTDVTVSVLSQQETLRRQARIRRIAAFVILCAVGVSVAMGFLQAGGKGDFTLAYIALAVVAVIATTWISHVHEGAYLRDGGRQHRLLSRDVPIQYPHAAFPEQDGVPEADVPDGTSPDGTSPDDVSGGDVGPGSVDDDTAGSTPDRPGPGRHRGQDAMIPLELRLEEAAFGTRREILVDTAILCPTCDGHAVFPAADDRTCESCLGNASSRSGHAEPDDNGRAATCPDCGGSGNAVAAAVCPGCAGEGRVRARQTVTLTIPPGVDDGVRIQLKGQGEVGPGGGPAGDLYIEVVELPHPVFRRHGDDLHRTVTVFSAEALRGKTCRVETLGDGTVEVDVPPKTRDGHEIVLPGLGAQHLLDEGRGDLVVRVVIGS